MTDATEQTTQVVIVASICIFMICLRVAYRIFFRCNIHARCHRKVQSDDIWMTLSVIPLLGRCLCIAYSSILAGKSEDPKFSSEERDRMAMQSLQLLIPTRIFYMGCLWFMKMCLLDLYLRLAEGLPFYRRIGLAIRCSLYITFVVVLLATLLECRPLKLSWNTDPAGTECRKARVNLLSMAICNIVTDVAMILFPIFLLRGSGLGVLRFLRLAILFALGSLIIITTIVRLPLILRSQTQKIRSLWASIEIVCACFVANAPFFQAAFLDLLPSGRGKHGMKSQEVGLGYDEISRVRTKSVVGDITESMGDRRRTGSGSRSYSGKSKTSYGMEEDDIDIDYWHIEKRVSFSMDNARESINVAHSPSRHIGEDSGDEALVKPLDPAHVRDGRKPF